MSHEHSHHAGEGSGNVNPVRSRMRTRLTRDPVPEDPISAEDKALSDGARASVTSNGVKIAAILNIAFTVVEFIGGALTNSLAVMADALHDLGDSMVLLSSWKIESLSQRSPDWKRTFGYRRMSLLAAFLNAVVLLGGSVIIFFQVIGRLVNPQPVHAVGIIWLAVLGIVVNTAGSLKLKKGGSLNERMISWHLLEDVLGWVGILLAGIIMHFTGFYRIDPVITIGFTVFVLWGVWRNSKELLNVFLEGVPSNVSLKELLRELGTITDVREICDIHVWSLDGKQHLCALKVIVKPGAMKDCAVLQGAIRKKLENYHIVHSTIELQEEQFHVHTQHDQAFLTN
ncbi:MAG: cation diffusion facilitator family transporter [bacterium]|nr:cation diffusion facilitator family transporter [bacterium]